MKLVNESVEEFKRGIDPDKSLNIGARRIMHKPIDWQYLPEGYYYVIDVGAAPGASDWHLYLKIKKISGENYIIARTD